MPTTAAAAAAAMRPLLRAAFGEACGSGAAFMARFSQRTIEHARPELGDRHDIDKDDEQSERHPDRHIAAAPVLLLLRGQPDAFWLIMDRHRSPRQRNRVPRHCKKPFSGD